jgi:hypothetical protein
MKRSLRFTAVKFAAAALWVAPVLLRAEAPATQPAADPSEALTPPVDQTDVTVTPNPSGEGNGAPGQADNRRPPRGQRFLQPLTEKEVADAMLFMSQHSKNRYEAIQSLPDGEKKTEIKSFTTRAYMSWMRMANEGSTLYPVVIKRIELEDEIFGKVTLLKKETDADKQKVLTDELKGDVGKLLDIGLKERKLRLEQLADIVKKEQKQLEDDSTNRALLVDERLKAILKSSDTSSLVPNAGEGGGSGGGGGGQGQHGHGPGRP